LLALAATDGLGLGLHPVRLIFSIIFVSIALAACKRSSEPSAPEHHYQLSGRVVALDRKHQIATIDAAAIPNFMEAMTMEYPVKSKADFDMLHVGDTIKATVDVSGSSAGDYYLSGIQKQNANK
jgi:Cu/Ag efflux protein CusF